MDKRDEKRITSEIMRLGKQAAVDVSADPAAADKVQTLDDALKSIETQARRAAGILTKREAELAKTMVPAEAKRQIEEAWRKGVRECVALVKTSPFAAQNVPAAATVQALLEALQARGPQ